MLRGVRIVTCGRTRRQRGVCVCVCTSYIHTLHTHRKADIQTDRSKAMSAFWQIDVAKTPTTYVVNVVCFVYLVYQLI